MAPAAASAAARRPPTKPVPPAMRVRGAMPVTTPRAFRLSEPGWAACEATPVSAEIHLLERSQRVEVAPTQAFELYSDALNLEPLTPPWLHFRVTTPMPIAMAAETRLDYRLRLHGVPIRWQTRIVSWDPPHGFVDVQAKGPYALWEHTHVFEPVGEAETVIHDRVRYAIPFGPLGALAHRLFVRRDLERIFDYRRDAVAALVAA